VKRPRMDRLIRPRAVGNDALWWWDIRLTNWGYGLGAESPDAERDARRARVGILVCRMIEEGGYLGGLLLLNAWMGWGRNTSAMPMQTTGWQERCDRFRAAAWYAWNALIILGVAIMGAPRIRRAKP
jgi:hypothetical protein